MSSLGTPSSTIACSKSSVKKLSLKGVTLEHTVVGVLVSVPVEAGEQARISPQYLSILSLSPPWPTHRPWGISM